MLTDKQRRFVELDLKKAEYKKFLEEYKQATEDLVGEIGVGGHFQDAKLHVGNLQRNLESDGISFTADGRFFKQGQTESITRERVLNRIGQVVDQFLESTTGGAQFARKTAEELGVDINDPQVKKAAEDLLFSALTDQEVERETSRFNINSFELLRQREALVTGRGTPTNPAFHSLASAAVIPRNKSNIRDIFHVGADGKLRMGNRDIAIQLSLDKSQAMLDNPDLERPNILTPTGVARVSDFDIIMGMTFLKLKRFFTSEGDIGDMNATADGRKIRQILLNTGTITEETQGDDLKEAVRDYVDDHFNSYANPEFDAVQGLTLPNNKNIVVSQEDGNKFFFGTNTGVPNVNSVSSALKFIKTTPGVEGAGLEFTGLEITEEVRDRKEGSLKVIGDVTNDNPYYAGARLVEDELGNSYYMQGSSEEVVRNNLEHSIHKAKYLPALRHEFKDGDRNIVVDMVIPTQQEQEEDIPVKFTLEFKGADGSNQVLEGTSTHDLFNQYVKYRIDNEEI